MPSVATAFVVSSEQKLLGHSVFYFEYNYWLTTFEHYRIFPGMRYSVLLISAMTCSHGTCEYALVLLVA